MQKKYVPTALEVKYASFRPSLPRKRSTLDTGKVSKVRQSDRDASDINNIIGKFRATGQLPAAQTLRGQYGDFSAVPDYQLACDTVIQAQAAFATLPARLRARFGNDPAALLAFLSDSRNQEEAVKLGLAEAKPKLESSIPVSPALSKAGSKAPKGAVAEAKTDPEGSVADA